MDKLNKLRAELNSLLNQSKATGTLVSTRSVAVSQQTSRDDVKKLAAIRSAHEHKNRFASEAESMTFHS